MPRAKPLSRERIVAAAMALSAKHGLEGLSMRRLGAALGVEAMSLYHFFPSKQHLVDALVDEAICSLQFPPESLPPVERMRGLMRSYRAMSHRYAHLYPMLAVHRLNTPTGVRMIEKGLAIAQDLTGDEESGARAFRTLGYYLMGAALDETRGYAKGPSAAEPVDDEFIARECPRLARSGKYFAREHWDRTFDNGVEDMLEGLARRSRKPRRALKPRASRRRTGSS